LTEQWRSVDAVSGRLLERNVLKRPDAADVVVDRYFDRVEAANTTT
jgi:hypothetical protein